MRLLDVPTGLLVLLRMSPMVSSTNVIPLFNIVAKCYFAYVLFKALNMKETDKMSKK